MSAVTHICVYCCEDLIEGEPYARVNADGRMHEECMLRMVAGSVGHQTGKCRCFGGTEDDPPGSTRRQGALAAAKLYLGRLPV